MKYMGDTASDEVELIAAAWQEFQACVPVKLNFIEDEHHFGAMVDFMNKLLDASDDQQAQTVSGMLHLVGFLVDEYEDRVEPVFELQDSLLCEAELRAAAAAKLYELGRVSQEVAAQIAGVSRGELLTLLSQLRVSPFQETAEEALTGAQNLV
jgi:predicted HTH domain antitoxin